MRRDTRSAQLHRVADAREGGRAAGLSGHEIEDLVVLLPIEEVQRGDAVAIATRRLFENAYDSIGVLVGEWPEQHAIDEAENCRVGADAESEGEQSNRGKPYTVR